MGRTVLKSTEGSREYFQFSAVKALDFGYSDISFLVGEAATLEGQGIPGVSRNAPGYIPRTLEDNEPCFNSSLPPASQDSCWWGGFTAMGVCSCNLGARGQI